VNFILDNRATSAIHFPLNRSMMTILLIFTRDQWVIYILAVKLIILRKLAILDLDLTHGSIILPVRFKSALE
jgi:hypothetical protein